MKTMNEHWIFLENLREMGVTNMFSAGVYLEAAFGMSKSEAREVLAEWMAEYDPDDYKEVAE